MIEFLAVQKNVMSGNVQLTMSEVSSENYSLIAKLDSKCIEELAKCYGKYSRKAYFLMTDNICIGFAVLDVDKLIYVHLNDQLNMVWVCKEIKQKASIPKVKNKTINKPESPKITINTKFLY
jgi:hypothetical protein